MEEFGLARDAGSYKIDSETLGKDAYFEGVFKHVYEKANNSSSLSGVNFWAYGGTGRPKNPGTAWSPGDDLIGDPPHELQGWYSVYDTDTSTLNVIEEYAKKM